jgi:hypothetical protein
VLTRVADESQNTDFVVTSQFISPSLRVVLQFYTNPIEMPLCAACRVSSLWLAQEDALRDAKYQTDEHHIVALRWSLIQCKAVIPK